MIRVVSWNVAKRDDPWHWLAEMAERGEADIALLQEAGRPPEGLPPPVRYENCIHWDQSLYDRWPLVVQLSDRVEVEWFRQVPPRSEIGEREIGASGIGTMAAARVAPRGRPQEAFIAVSMYARWMRAHPSTKKNPGLHADLSAHRILSDMQTFMAYAHPSRYRILAAGDLNLIYAATGSGPWFRRERVVWDRFDALGMEFLGPQVPNGRQPAARQPGTPADTKNLPTYYTARQRHAANAVRQLDYVFASRGFHEQVKVCALNGLEEWGPSDHCRLLIEISAPKPPAQHPKLTIDAIRQRAVHAGVGGQFNRFLNMAKASGLGVKAWPLSVTIAPRNKLNRTMIYARPEESGDGGGRLHIWVATEAVVEFFPHLHEQKIIEALAMSGSDWQSSDGEALDALLDRIERFLKESVLQPDADGG